MFALFHLIFALALALALALGAFVGDINKKNTCDA